MSESKRPTTGYQVCQAQVALIEAEQAHMRKMQKARDPDGDNMAGPIRALSQSCAVLQSEIRKTGQDADRAVDKLGPDKKLELVLKIAKDMSPDDRMIVSAYLEELGTKLL